MGALVQALDAETCVDAHTGLGLSSRAGVLAWVVKVQSHGAGPGVLGGRGDSAHRPWERPGNVSQGQSGAPQPRATKRPVEGHALLTP